jgi:6-phosphogluconate dehydrogenase
MLTWPSKVCCRIWKKEILLLMVATPSFPDTNRRVLALAEKKIHFFGMGISGGEKGARYGPSMMPGGDKQAYKRLRPVFEAIAAKVNNEPCVDYMGNDSAVIM